MSTRSIDSTSWWGSAPPCGRAARSVPGSSGRSGSAPRRARGGRSRVRASRSSRSSGRVCRSPAGMAACRTGATGWGAGPPWGRVTVAFAGRPRYHPGMANTTVSDRLYFTGDEEADRLLVSEPLALLIGFALDQQVTVQKAFSGPLELKRRLGFPRCREDRRAGPVDARRGLPAPAGTPSLPGPMATKVQALCAAIARDYDNDAAPDLDRGQGRQGPRAATARLCPASGR